MRKIYITSILLAFGICFSLTGPVPVRASPDSQALRVGADALFNYLPLVFRPLTTAGVYGKVVDAADGLGIAGAMVCYESLCVFTTSSGEYTLQGLPSGQLTMVVSKEGYLELAEKVTTQVGQSVYHQFVLSESTFVLTNVYIRSIVTWSAEEYVITPLGTFENDLDAHMWFDNGALLLHLYSGSGDGTNECNAAPYMCLLVDRRLGSGPEVIDISQLESAHYYFGVFNVNQAYDWLHYPQLNQLSTIVRLNDDNGLAQTFYAPLGAGNFWYVFKMDSTGLVTIMNCMTYYPGDNIPTCPSQ